MAPPSRDARTLPTIDLGSGHPLVVMQGFGLQPRTYLGAAKALATRSRVLVPALFTEPGLSWSPGRVLDDLERTLDLQGVDRMTLIGHSFGGGLELEFTVRHPDRVTELVFIDTLAMAHEWSLAAEALHPAAVVWMATPGAARDFLTSAVRHPMCLVRAGWWGFRSDRHEAVATVAASTIPTHVLWADRDSLLSRRDGAAFAHDLGADFTVVHGPRRHPVDHDWMYRHPHLLLHHLERLGLQAWADDRAGPAGALADRA